MSEYMNVLVISGLIPFILSFWPPLKIYRNAKALILSIFLIVVIYGAWDVFATSRGHWWFNPQSVGTFKIINLPLEEVLFFVVIPFCCIFSWEVIKYFKSRFKSFA
ncbi:MAG: lycopene cyclase domain-containing protein [Candidatus Omnitrophota bacterium]|nr:MAG: lycopene cyclase domain-containing protein [Candidatus Omnitrophota bacterium]